MKNDLYLGREIPEASLRRLPVYYRSLQGMSASGVTQVSCADLARVLGLDPTQVRKDIEMTGIVGKPRVGYELGELTRWIENFLGWNRPKEAVLAGAGSLGSALLGYEKFRKHGMEIVACFDIDPEKIGQQIHGREVQPLMFLPDFVRQSHTLVGVIATPAAAAQKVADLMVAGGICAIWNFAPAHVQVPARVILQNEDLYHSLASLSFKLESRRVKAGKTESDMAKTIDITELVLRDAHQSLMATRMAMEDMAPACADIDKAGYWSVECWGGATFDSCIRFLNEDPWERLRQFRKLLPNSRLQMLLRGQNLLGYRHYEDTVVDRFVDKAAENGMDVFRVFDALNDIRNLRRAVAAVRRTGKHAQGTICYTVSPLHTAGDFVEMAEKLLDLGCDSICIKDMAALLKPQPAYDIVKGIKEACGQETRVHVHVHATTGVTLVSLMKAIEAGADCVDTAISSLSLGPGHNPTESLVEMLEGTGFDTKLDKSRLISLKKYFAGIRPRYQEFLSNITGVETEIFDSQIPGGMLSNMESQLKQQGAGERMEEVLLEVPKVRAEAGFPPLVTPSSQIVGTQAVFNVMMGRYKVMTGEFADLMLGYYGECMGPRDRTVVEQAFKQTGKNPINGRPADLLKPEWHELRDAAVALTGCNGADEDVLTYAMFPKVAPKFFSEREKGPKNLGKDPAAAAPAAPAAPAKAAGAENGKSSVRTTITYDVKCNGKTHKVTVAPAK